MSAAPQDGAASSWVSVPRGKRRRLWAGVVAAAACYAIVTPWVLRPWFLAHDLLPHTPGPAGAMLDADLYLNLWILAWIAHAVLTDPTRLYDGNIFYPAPNTIAGSENMLAHLPITAPVLALTGNALVMLKAYVLESFVLSGVAMFLFVRHHTRDCAAALLAGAAFTFTFFRAQTIPQPQYLGIQYLPLALLCVDLWLERRRVGWLVGLALAIGLQALSCVYIGFFTLIAVPVYALLRLLDVRQRRGAVALPLVLALGGGVLALLPVALPYLRARAEGMIPRQDPAMIHLVSWAPWQYFSRGFLERAGVVPVALVALDVLSRLARRMAGRAAREVGAATRSVERGLWAVLATGVVLSAGPSLDVAGISIPMPYQLLYALLPGFSSLRVPIRFALVVAAAVAALAALAFARWSARLAPRTRLAAAAVLVLACAFDAAPRPVPVIAANLGSSAAPVDRWLAAQTGDGSVLEIPGTAGAEDMIGNTRSGRAMVSSTIHWKPLVNGWTAYPPHAAGLLSAAIRELPEPAALALLADTSRLRWIVLHRDQLLGEEAVRWPRGAIAGLALVQTFGDTDVYELERAPARDLRADIVARSRQASNDTLAGTSTAVLPEACRAARFLAIDAPPRMLPIPAPRRVAVRFENSSSCPWPGLGVRPDGLVALTYRWTSPSGKQTPLGPVSRLLADVAPGATVDTSMLVTQPAGEIGTWQLEVILFQEGGGDALASALRPVELRALGSGARVPGAAQPGAAGSSS
jgi:hypothetical protein